MGVHAHPFAGAVAKFFNFRPQLAQHAGQRARVGKAWRAAQVTGWSVKRPATMSGKTAFLDPEIANVPCSGVPPSMRMRSISAIASCTGLSGSAG